MTDTNDKVIKSLENMRNYFSSFRMDEHMVFTNRAINEIVALRRQLAQSQQRIAELEAVVAKIEKPVCDTCDDITDYSCAMSRWDLAQELLAILKPNGPPKGVISGQPAPTDEGKEI